MAGLLEGSIRKYNGGEAKQLEGNTDGILLLFERLIYRVVKNSRNTLNYFGVNTLRTGDANLRF